MEHHQYLLHAYAASPVCPPHTRASLLSALPPPTALAASTDRAALLAAFTFLAPDPDEPAPASHLAPADAAWQARLAARYYAALNKEFALCDLSRAPRLGLRWRSAAEVAAGKGQFTCGALGCAAVAGLHSYEVPFSYEERGVARSALVKARLCGACASRDFAGAGGRG